LTDVEILICPSDGGDLSSKDFRYGGGEDSPVNPCRIESESYIYFGHLLTADLVYGTRDANDPNIPVDVFEAAAQGYVDAELGVAFDGFGRAVNTANTPEGVAQAFAVVDADVCASDYAESFTTVVYRLREGVERFLITDINDAAASAKAQSGIPVLFDRLSLQVESYNHVPGGSNVLFFDGHVAFLRYPGAFPVSRLIAVIIGAFSEP